MEINQAIIALGALAQETRLRAFQLLVAAGSQGAAAGTLSKGLGIPHNTLSFHLSHLVNAGLASSRRRGRSIIYLADFAFVQQLVRFMVENCCSMESATIRDDRRRKRAVIELSDCCNP